MREGGQYRVNIQYQYLDREGRGLVFCSRFSAERLLQKGHLFASGDAKSSNTGMSYQYLPSGKKHLARSKHLHLARNIWQETSASFKESGHCLASQLLLRIEWSQLAHINSAACCLVGGPAVSQSQCRAAACSSDGHHPRLEKLWLMLALPRGPQAKGSATSAMNFELWIFSTISNFDAGGDDKLWI